MVKFQFHYGAIKTTESTYDVLNKKKFQFHYGAIKTEQAHLHYQKKQYFNSIMVRLRRCRPHGKCL